MHNIKTIADIIKVVNNDNLKNFLQDFQNYLCMHVALKNISEGGDIEIIQEEQIFSWIDDGKNDADITIEIKTCPTQKK
jgi:hypothetical protein